MDSSISNEEYVDAIRGRLLSPEQIEFMEKSLGAMKHVHEKSGDCEYIVYHYLHDESCGLPYSTCSKNDAFEHARKWCTERRTYNGSASTCCVVIDANEDEAIGCVSNWSEAQGMPVAMSAWLELFDKMKGREEGSAND